MKMISLIQRVENVLANDATLELVEIKISIIDKFLMFEIKPNKFDVEDHSTWF